MNFGNVNNRIKIYSIPIDHVPPDHSLKLQEEDASLFENSYNITKSAVELNSESSTKDGKIGYTMQGRNPELGINTGDCWVLNTVTSLSYTQKGAEIIKNALEYQNDGTIVHTSYFGDYYVSNAEVEDAKNSPSYYSDGDDDMIIIELAVQKLKDEQLQGKFSFKPETPDMIKNIHNSGFDNEINSKVSSLRGGFSEQMFYILTGKIADTVSSGRMEEVLRNFRNNQHTDYALTASTPSGGTTVVNNLSNNEEVTIPGGHGYSIKSFDTVDGVDRVTFTNPFDTSSDITITKEKFLSIFSSITVFDLSDSARTENFVERKE